MSAPGVRTTRRHRARSALAYEEPTGRKQTVSQGELKGVASRRSRRVEFAATAGPGRGLMWRT